MGLKILREMRGSALWDACKWAFQKGWPLLMPIVYAGWAAIMSRPDWAAAGFLFIAALTIVGTQEYFRRRRVAPAPLPVEAAPLNTAPQDRVFPGQSTDQKTFEDFKRRLPDKCIMQVRSQAFQAKFQWDADAALASFLRHETSPDRGFLDEALESLRRQLREAVTLLLDRVHRFSDPPPGEPQGNIRFFWKGDHEDIGAYDARRNEVFEAARNVCKIYDGLVLTARRKFDA